MNGTRAALVACVVVCGVSQEAYSQKAYWTSSVGRSVQRADLDGSNVEELVSDAASSVIGLALDVPRDKMYWTTLGTNRGGIWRSDLDGTGVEELAPVRLPSQLALDQQGQTLYWGESLQSTAGGNYLLPAEIWRASLDEFCASRVLTTFVISGLEFDFVDRKIYWCGILDASNPTEYGVFRANADGSNIETVVDTGNQTVRAIELDPFGRKLYWSDSATGFNRSNLDGSDVENLSVSGPGRFDIDFTNDRVYSGISSASFNISDLDGSNLVEIPAPGGPQRFAFDNQPQIPAVSGLGIGALGVLLIVAGAAISRKRRRNESEVEA